MKLRKYISVFLAAVFVFISAFALFPTSASAAEEVADLKCIDVLTYDYPDNNTSAMGRMEASRPYHVFDLPFSYGLVYFDIIFETRVSFSSAGIRSMSSGSFYSLTVTSLGSNRYRCYGQTSAAFNSAQFAFQVNSSAEPWTVTYYKFDVYTVIDLGTGDLGEMNITPNADTSISPNYWYRQSQPGVPIVQDFSYFSSSNQFYDFNVKLSSVNWRKYDYLDFQFKIDAATIGSISAYVKFDDINRFLPFDISFLNADAIDKNEFVGSGTTTVIPAGTYWNVLMRVYIPAQYRSSGSLFIDIVGQYKNPASRCTLSSVNGYYYTSVPSPDLVKLDQITQAIKDSLSSSESQNAAAEDFSTSINSAAQGASSNISELGSLEKPSLEDFNAMIDPNILLDGNGISLLVTTFLPITDSHMVLSIMLLSCTFGIISFCLFGKKG